MGEVFLGFDEALERDVAVKALGEHRRLDANAKARLLREARLLSKLDHPGICRIHDLVEGDDADYLILEYIEGRTLREIGSKLTPDEILDVFTQVADALAAAHAQDIVHRDLKPENIMITPGMRAKILDFGIARSYLDTVGTAPARTPGECLEPATEIDDEAADGLRTPIWPPPNSGSESELMTGHGTPMTREGAVLGTVRYMSPEQARGERVGPPGDMYSLGVMLQETTSGRSAYGEARGMELMMRAARAETAPVEDLEDELTQLVGDLENLDPRRRPPAAETASRLRWIADRPHRERRRRTRRALVVAGALVAVVAAGALIWSELRSRRRIAIAQSFAAEARDITWMMRAEYLSPLHDLEPARARVRARQRLLEEKMRKLGSLARGPGELALGQVLLELSDFEEARKHVDNAWAAGIRSPEAAFARSIVYGRLYRLGIREARQIRDPEAREREMERLRTELRDPALEMLRQDLDETIAPAAYIEGLIAQFEERFEDGLAAVARLTETAPWMYEAPILEGQCHYYLSGTASFENRDLVAEIEHLEKSSDAFRRAIEIGRSYPPAWARLCGNAAKLTESRLLQDHNQVSEADIDENIAICEQASMLDSHAVVPYMGMAGLSVLRARVQIFDGQNPSASFLDARNYADRAVEVDPEQPAAHTFSGWVSFWLASNRYRSGQDPMDETLRAIESYEAAIRLQPEYIYAVTLLGDVYWMAASWSQATGTDPDPWIDGGLAAIESLKASSTNHGSLRVVRANLLLLRAQVEARRGDDSRPSLEEAVAIYRQVSAGSSSPDDHRMHAEAERRLAFAVLEHDGDPAPYLDAAHAALDRAGELNSALPGIDFERGAAYLVAAKSAHADRRPSRPILETAISHLERATVTAHDRAAANLYLAIALVDDAQWRLEDGRPLGSTLNAARDAVAAALRIQPHWLDPVRVQVEAEILEGRWLDSRGRDPRSAYARAATLLDTTLVDLKSDIEVNDLRDELRKLQESGPPKDGPS